MHDYRDESQQEDNDMEALNYQLQLEQQQREMRLEYISYRDNCRHRISNPQIKKMFDLETLEGWKDKINAVWVHWSRPHKRGRAMKELAEFEKEKHLTEF